MSTRIIRPNIWYFPSNYGDIRLEAVDNKTTKVIWFRLTVDERKAMETLRKRSIRLSMGGSWANKSDWDKIGEASFSLGDPSERSIILHGPLVKVGEVLTKALRPDRGSVHVMRIGQGKIEEFRNFEQSPEEQGNVVEITDHVRKKDGADDEATTALAKTGTDGEATTALAKTGTDDAVEPTKVATVKKPVQGCPIPTFDQVKKRATAVLRAFLDPSQIADFEKYQRFVTRGVDTDHLYMLTSRNAPDEIAHYGSRCVFDLDENRPYCVHDYDVPAEEELLALHCLLSLPGYETWARGEPDAMYVPAG